MKKLIFTIFLFLLHLSLFSQDENAEKKFSKSISVNLKVVDFQSDRKTYDEIEAGYGIDLQASYYYKINDYLLLRTGIEASYLSSNTKDYSFVFACDLNQFPGSNAEQSFAESTMDWFYLNVPIELQVTLLNDGKRIYIKGGIDNLFHVFGKSKSYIHECGGDPSDFSGLTFDAKRFYGQVNVGFGFEFNINNKTKFFVEPNLEYAFSNTMNIPTSIGEKVKSRVFNLGIHTGIRF